MNPEKTREALFSCLNSILIVSQKKFKIEQKRDCERRSWGRLIVQTVQAYGKLLETAQLDDLAREIEEIKKHVGVEP